MEDLEKAGRELKAGLKSYVSLLNSSFEEFEASGTSHKVRDVVKKQFDLAAEVLKPFIGVPHSHTSQSFRRRDCFYDSGDLRIRLDREGRVKRIMIDLGCYPCAYLVCERKRKGPKCYVKREGSIYRGISNYFDKRLMKMTNSEIHNTVSNLCGKLGRMVDILSRPLVSARNYSKRIFCLSDKFFELEEKVGEKVRELHEELKGYGSCSDGVNISVDELLAMGVLPKVEPKKLEKPVLELLKNRDQRVPRIMAELGEKNPRCFHHLLKSLEAKANERFSELKILPLSEVQREFSYFKNCGLDVEEYKRAIKLSLKKKEKERRKKLSGFLRGLDEI